jgi:hypothetical protein
MWGLFGSVSSERFEQFVEAHNELLRYVEHMETRIRVLEGTAPSDSRVTHTVPVAAQEGNVFYPTKWGR